MENTLFTLTGTAIPLGALRTSKCSLIGEYSALKDMARFCKKTGMQIIQLLPVNDSGSESSPYSALTAFALHPIYISIPELKTYQSDSKIQKDYESFVKENQDSRRYDYKKILKAKIDFLQRIYKTETDSPKDFLSLKKKAASFIEENPWIKEYAVYKRLKEQFAEKSWTLWPKEYQNPSAKEIESLFADKNFEKQTYFFIWCQIQAFAQFLSAKEFVKKQGILLKGDIPFLVNMDSDCVWAKREYFNTKLTAGSPPDSDNPYGQKWGFPCYNWTKLKKDSYIWWKQRLQVQERFFDACRLDHLLGFFRVWAIPPEELRGTMGYCFSAAQKDITKDALLKAGFSESRIKWLSKPHISTQKVCELSGLDWNCVSQILPAFMNRIGSEDLWLFKEEIKGSSDLLSMADEQNRHLAQILAELWEDRCLIEISPGHFCQKWNYFNSTSWNSLDQAEKDTLSEIINETLANAEKLWKKNATEILSQCKNASSMQLCAEDLGAPLSCIPSVLHKLKILALKVIRWERRWESENQPFIDFSSYEKLAVSCTSVHDSTTLRQWWNKEKSSVKEFIKACIPFETTQTDSKKIQDELESYNKKIEILSKKDFSPDMAYFVLADSAQNKSLWFINPLQDYLYLDSKYYSDEESERINIPGTVSPNNWTYRMPCTIEELCTNNSLIKKIKEIVSIHNKGEL